MRKIILKFGLIGGVIVGSVNWLIATMCSRDVVNFDQTMIIGYAGMLVALSMIFFGIKSFRDHHGKGKISFWKGVQIGLLITLVASLMYYAGWELFAVT